MPSPFSRDDLFEQSLRKGPPRREPSPGFAQRVENSWRHAPTVEHSSPGFRWRAFLSDLMGPAVALASIALVVVFIQQRPALEPSPAPVTAAVSSPAVDPLDILPGGSLANLRASLDGAYAEETRLLAADATRALRFAASQFMSPEMIERVEGRGWLNARRGTEGS